MQQKRFFRGAVALAVVGLLAPVGATAKPRSASPEVTRGTDRERLAFLSGMSYGLKAMLCHMTEPALVPDLEVAGSEAAQQLAFASQITVFSCPQIQAIVHLTTHSQPKR